ncbi:MAG: hypothetical protein ABFR35_05775 [Thermodesulfobacteriota bacterium]
MALLFLCLFVLSSCVTLPKDAFKLSPTSLEDRQLQSRKFTTLDNKLLLSAGASVLQDMGYTIDESNTALGVLTASKQADATDAGQIAGAIAVALLTGVMTPTDKEQKIRICLVIQEALDEQTSSVARITIQRMIWNTQGQISRVERIHSPELYQAFFDKLSKATFLEANQI